MNEFLFVLSAAAVASAACAGPLQGQRPSSAPDGIAVFGVINERGPLEWGPAPAGPAHAPRLRRFHLQHQDVTVSFDWTRHAIVGSTTLHIAALDKAIESVSLDAMGMTIQTVTNEAGRDLPREYDGRMLIVRLPAALRPGDSTTITVRYEAVRPPVGVYFVERRHVVWTQGRLEDNRYWVPTYDYPNDKTTWDFHIKSAANERAFATGQLVGQRPVNGGIEWHWVESTPAPTYYMTVAVGPYATLADSAGSVALRYWAYPDSLTAARNGFAETHKIIDFFTRKLGTPFPSASFDQVVVPDFIFWDWLESWRPLIPAVVQDERLILRRETGWPGEDANLAIARAVAQQWFGKLVTPADWSHLWLSDGIASYLAIAYAEDASASNPMLEAARWSQVSTFAADRDARRPLVFDHWQYGPIELLLTEHVTQKSVVVLRLLHAELGDAAFWSGMRRYLADHANGSATTADFEHAMERASGRDLSVFFRQWVYGAGFPFLRVGFQIDSAAKRVTFDVEQFQKRDALTGFFDANVDVEVLSDAGVARSRMPLHGERSKLSMSVPGIPRAVRFDPDKVLPSEVRFERPLPMLIYQLQHDSAASGRSEAAVLLAEQLMQSLARSGMISFSQGQRPRLDHPEVVAALLRAARNDPSIRVRQEAIAMLGPASMLDESVESELLQLTRDRVPTIRMLAVISASHSRDSAVVARLSEMASSDPDPKVRAVATGTPGGIESVDEYAAAKQKLENPATSEEEKAQLLATVAGSSVPGGWNIAKQYLIAPTSSRMVREAAMRTLGIAVMMREAMQGPDPKAVVDLIAPFLDVDDPSLRLSAARELGMVKVPASKAALVARKSREVDARVLHEIDRSLREIDRRERGGLR